MKGPDNQFSESSDNPNELTQKEANKLQATGKSNGYKQTKKLLPRHHLIIDHVLEGWSAREIADKYDMERGSVSMLSRTPLFQEELARRRKQRESALDLAAHSERSAALEHLEKSALNAAQTQTNLLDDDDPRVRQKAASEILKRVYGDQPAAGKGDGKVGTQVVLEGPTILNINTAMAEVQAASEARKGPTEPIQAALG